MQYLLWLWLPCVHMALIDTWIAHPLQFCTTLGTKYTVATNETCLQMCNATLDCETATYRQSTGECYVYNAINPCIPAPSGIRVRFARPNRCLPYPLGPECNGTCNGGGNCLYGLCRNATPAANGTACATGVCQSGICTATSATSTLTSTITSTYTSTLTSTITSTFVSSSSASVSSLPILSLLVLPVCILLFIVYRLTYKKKIEPSPIEVIIHNPVYTEALDVPEYTVATNTDDIIYYSLGAAAPSDYDFPPNVNGYLHITS